jgi:serine/threonine protein kinase
MSEPPPVDWGFLPPAVEAVVDEACDRFEAACQEAGSAGPLPRIEDYLIGGPGPEREALAQELISLDVHYRRQRGEMPRPEEYRGRFPDLAAEWLAAAVEEAQAPERGPGHGTTTEPSSEGDPLDELAEEFTARYRRGEQPSVTEYAEKYPELAPRIRALFPALVAMEQARSVAGALTGPIELQARDASPPPERLGDYRLQREIGRGGMGVVYEAVQESLGRHVALKILPFHRLLGPTHLERFRRETRAAAQLHHTNIVPVFGVGEAEGVHYYAMQFIQGQGIDVVLEEVRRLRGRKNKTGKGSKESTPDRPSGLAQGLLSDVFQEMPDGVCPAFAAPEILASPANPLEAANTCHPAERSAAGQTTDTLSELIGQTEAQYCRSVAQVGVQVAEALAYAHKQRILHRDIKPSNLLLDRWGTVWITDFGLAKAEGSDDLTGTGDIVGTVRYMAPERFQGRADPCSDLYSLGITLYEMLTLRPAFAGSDRARLVERVMQEEPPRPRTLAGPAHPAGFGDDRPEGHREGADAPLRERRSPGGGLTAVPEQ